MSTPRGTNGVEHEYSYGVLLLVNGITGSVSQCLERIQLFSFPPARVVIVDRGARSALEGKYSVNLGFAVDHWWTGDDMGVAGSIEIGLRYLSECDSVLLIDDETVLGSHTVESMLSVLTEQVGAVVAVPSPQTEPALISGVRPHEFGWFPSMLRSEVINSVGPPLAEMFSGYDDLEYGLRISRHGYSIALHPLKSVDKRETNRPNVYLLARNLTYVLVHKRRWSVSFLKDWFSFCVMATRPSQTAIRKGLLDGLRRRVGPPPPGLNRDEIHEQTDGLGF